MHHSYSPNPQRVGRWATACDKCRAKKKRCDGQTPCSSCKTTKENCTYLSKFQQRNSPETNNHLIKVGSRRHFFEAYTVGFFCPAVLFGTTKLSANSFDFPQTQPLLLQYNTILASASRALGAPTSVYEVFEQKARVIAKDLLIDFTHETALGFHMLAMHYWGSNPELCEQYRDLTISICNRALRRPQNRSDIVKLINLNLVTIGIQDGDRNQPALLDNNAKMLEENVRGHFPGFSLSGTTAVNDYFNFAQFHVLLSGYLLGCKEDDAVHFTELEERYYHMFSGTFKGVVNKLLTEKTTTPTILLTRALDEFLMGLAIYLKDPCSNLFHIEIGVEIFAANESIMGLSGPRFIAIFDSAFKVAYLEKRYDLALKIAELERRQAKFFPAAIPFAGENTTMIQSAQSMQFQSCTVEEVSEEDQQFILAPLSPLSGVISDSGDDPFGSSIHRFQLPVLQTNSN